MMMKMIVMMINYNEYNYIYSGEDDDSVYIDHIPR